MFGRREREEKDYEEDGWSLFVEEINKVINLRYQPSTVCICSFVGRGALVADVCGAKFECIVTN